MPKLKPTDPQFIEIPPQKMAVVTTVGDPNVVAQPAISALYGAAYTLKFALKKQGREFKVGALRARWPDIHPASKDQWVGIWGLPIPEDTTGLIQKVPGVEVLIETWEYGTVAQILHRGPYSEEPPTIQCLHEFIAAKGYEIAGAHEEEGSLGLPVANACSPLNAGGGNLNSTTGSGSEPH